MKQCSGIDFHELYTDKLFHIRCRLLFNTSMCK